MNLTGLIAKKNGQTQAFLEDGTRIPVSALAASGNTITQIKTSEKEGYNSVQLGFGIKKRPNKATNGHSKKAGLDKAVRFFREVRLLEPTDLELGSSINVEEVLGPGDIVDVTGVSKGKGFAGGVKRHGFHGGPKTHGQSDRHRAPGSIGQGTTPGRVFKGKKMAGHMGAETVTVKNLVVMEVTKEGVILVKGLVPGPKNGILMIKKVGEKKKFVPLLKQKEEATEDQDVEQVAEKLTEEVQVKQDGVGEVSEEQAEEIKSDQVKEQGEPEKVEVKVKTTEDVVETGEEKVETAEEKVEAPAEGEEPTDSEAKEEKKEAK